MRMHIRYLGLSLDDVQGNINDLRPGKPFAVLDLGDDADVIFHDVEEIGAWRRS